MGNTPWSTVTIHDNEVSLSDNNNLTDEMAEIVDIKVPAGMRYEFPSEPVYGGLQMFLMTHESATAPTGTNTISTSNDLVNSPALSEIGTSSSETAETGHTSLVVFDDTADIQTGVSSVNYSGNSFDYSNGTASSKTLHFWYTWGDASQIEFRHYDKSVEDYDRVGSETAAGFHTRNVHTEQQQEGFGRPFTAGPKEHLKVYINTPVNLTNWDDLDAGSGPATSAGSRSYSYFQFPVRKHNVR